MSNYFNKEENDSYGHQDASANLIQKLKRYYQIMDDKIQFYKSERWMIIGVLSLFYIIRILYCHGIIFFKYLGYHALTYCLGIHILNAFIGFISPLEDSDDDGGAGEGNSFLPQNDSEEFRPFQRKVKESHFWHVCFWSLLIGCVLTFFDSLNVPVYWPLLLVYFILIFFVTMRKQIKHMFKYKYLPWDSGKAKYGVNN